MENENQDEGAPEPQKESTESQTNDEALQRDVATTEKTTEESATEVASSDVQDGEAEKEKSSNIADTPVQRSRKRNTDPRTRSQRFRDIKEKMNKMKETPLADTEPSTESEKGAADPEKVAASQGNIQDKYARKQALIESMGVKSPPTKTKSQRLQEIKEKMMKERMSSMEKVPPKVQSGSSSADDRMMAEKRAIAGRMTASSPISTDDRMMAEKRAIAGRMVSSSTSTEGQMLAEKREITSKIPAPSAASADDRMLAEKRAIAGRMSDPAATSSEDRMMVEKRAIAGRMATMETPSTQLNEQENADGEEEESEAAQLDRMMAENRGVAGRMTTVAINRSENSSAAPNPTTAGPINPTVTVSKTRQEVGSEKPGAYQMTGRAVGFTPAWVRNGRQSIRSMFSRSEPQQDDQSHLPPEMRRASNQTVDESHLPPEMRSAPQIDQSNLPPEMRFVNDCEPQHQSEAFQLDDEHANVANADVVRKSQFVRSSNNNVRKKIWIAAGAVVLIGAGIGLGVGLSGSNGSDKNDSQKNNPKAQMCQRADFESNFTTWMKCLCDGDLEITQEKDTTIDSIVSEVLLNHTDVDYNASSCEPQNLALNWLAEDTLRRGGEINDTLLERYALATCFLSWINNNANTQWMNQTGWMTTNSVCDWFNITCNDMEEVTSIVLRENNLVGEIPTEISLLSSLDILDLSQNQISGAIPTEIGVLTNLWMLDLSLNRILGIIPTEIGYLTKMAHFYLYANNIGGVLPSEIGNLTLLQDLEIQDNPIGGTLPSEIGNLKSLKTIHAGGHFDGGINGTIPSEIGLCISLESIQIIQTLITGSIPTQVGMLSNLQTVILDSNQMSGSLPSVMGSCGSLSAISLNDNKITGPIPSEIGMLTNLKGIWARNNKLTGSIPPSIGDLLNLEQVQIQGNFLTGIIPTEIGSLRALNLLEINSNKISGSIPSELGNCQSLKHIDISLNLRLRETLPSELGNLSNLERFEFFDTGLTGTIPDEICSLREGNLKSLVAGVFSSVQCD